MFDFFVLGKFFGISPLGARANSTVLLSESMVIVFLVHDLEDKLDAVGA